MLFNVIFGLQQVAELSDSHRCIALDNRGVGGTFAQTWALTPNALRDAVAVGLGRTVASEIV